MQLPIDCPHCAEPVYNYAIHCAACDYRPPTQETPESPRLAFADAAEGVLRRMIAGEASDLGHTVTMQDQARALLATLGKERGR